MPEKVFLNDDLLDAGQACLPVTDSGLLYGAGLFETMRSHNGVVFRLEDHLDRLLRSASALSINHAYDKPRLNEAVYAVLKANGLTDARLRMTLTNGPLSETADEPNPTLLITATLLKLYPVEHYERGVRVVLCPYRQNTTDPIGGHKTTNYYPRLLALTLARRQGAAEALWFTEDNRLAEGSVSNVFLVKGSVLHTPAVSTPVLPGIARRTICEIAEREGIELAEKDLTVDDLLAADEVFLTNVIMEALPVVSVEKHQVGNGECGALTRRLRELFLAALEEYCRSQE
jgi:branched-chain amino acid aminotransferase